LALSGQTLTTIWISKVQTGVCESCSPQRLTATNAWTEPAGTVVAGSAGAGQLTPMFATHVDEFGGNKYVIFALRAASAGGDPFIVPVILPWFVK
jgi:hypothetical protein